MSDQSITIPQPVTTKLLVDGLFAVYGTLRQGCGNHRALDLANRAEYVADDTVKGTLYHLGGFPGLLPEGDTDVVVEVYRLLDPQLAISLDSLEGYRVENPADSFYIRSKVVTAGGLTCDIYYYNRDLRGGTAAIESGDWMTANDYL